jgi:hypothetical protein
MGLDQYLYAKKYYSDGKWQGEENNTKFRELLRISEMEKFIDKTIPSIFLEVKIGQWRKANAIHKWFVENCQNGEDDCREAYVSREKLEELKALCKSVLLQPAVADEELPTQQGFFFGSYEYDEWYFGDLKQTVEIIDNALSVSDDWSFYYSSSW